LAAVQGIVRRQRGVMFVHSAPGQGTTFRILLPASDREAAISQRPQASASSIRGGSVALVIDDETTVRNVAEGVLSRKGIKVLTAENAEPASNYFASTVL